MCVCVLFDMDICVYVCSARVHECIQCMLNVLSYKYIYLKLR